MHGANETPVQDNRTETKRMNETRTLKIPKEEYIVEAVSCLGYHFDLGPVFMNGSVYN